jgi:GNAT superfamily N-acetyltransferase
LPTSSALRAFAEEPAEWGEIDPRSGLTRLLPQARGRGVYRALVRARWDDAVALGTPALCVHAGAMSRPILERRGFTCIGEVDVLGDRATC